MERDGKTYIFLVGQRKSPWWTSKDTEGWTCEGYERFDYVECGVYSKPTVALNEGDYQLAISYGEPGENWQAPSEWAFPQEQVITSIDGDTGKYTLGPATAIFNLNNEVMTDPFAGRKIVFTKIEQKFDPWGRSKLEMTMEAYDEDARWLYEMAIARMR